MTNCGEAKNEVQQRTKKSSHFQMTICGQAKNQVQQRTKKSSHFEKTNCGQAKPKCIQITKIVLQLILPKYCQSSANVLH